MEKKCKVCGIYEILHKSMDHVFIDPDFNPLNRGGEEEIRGTQK